MTQKRRTRKLGQFERLEERTVFAFTGVPGGNVDLSAMPAYSSNASSQFKVHLDFNGGVTTSFSPFYTNIGPFGSNPEVRTPAFDVDGDPTKFNLVEQLTIRKTWLTVAEDFAPFNVDITTANSLASTRDTLPFGTPTGSATALKFGESARVMIGGTRDQWFDANNVRLDQGDARAVAQLNSFKTNQNSSANNVDTGATAFVFKGFLRNNNFNWVQNAAANATEAQIDQISSNNARILSAYVSKQIGTMLGLRSQSLFINGGLVQFDWTGQNGWAPIMGDSAFAGVGTWWNGRAPDGSPQNDVALIAAAFAGGGGQSGFRDNDLGNTLQTAFGVNANGLLTEVNKANGTMSYKTTSLIGSTGDVDYYRVSLKEKTALNVKLDLGFAPNLLATVDIFNAQGRKIGTKDISAADLQLAIQELREGTYYVGIHSRAVTVLDGQANVPPTTPDPALFGRIGTYSLEIQFVPTSVPTLIRDNTPTPSTSSFTVAGTGAGAWKYARTVKDTITGDDLGFDNDVSIVAARRAAARAPISTATWTFTGLRTGRYEVFASWVHNDAEGVIAGATVPLGPNTTTAKYTILDGRTTRATYLADQTVASDSVQQLGFTKITAAPIEMRGTTMFVRLSNEESRDGNVIADAVFLVRVGDLPATAAMAALAMDNSTTKRR